MSPCDWACCCSVEKVEVVSLFVVAYSLVVLAWRGRGPDQGDPQRDNMQRRNGVRGLCLTCGRRRKLLLHGGFDPRIVVLS